MAKVLTTVELNGIESKVWVEVPENEPAAWEQGADMAVVGKPHPRVDGFEKVSGRAKYTHDVSLPGMTWMKILHSPYPHARVRSISTRRAQQMAGVALVWTPDDVKEHPWYRGMSHLLTSEPKYVGDEIALVVAETEQVAREALTAIDVEYEELPFVLDGESSLKPDAPKIHKDGNLMSNRVRSYSRGDTEKGFAEADYIVEESFQTQVQVHACLETHSSVAQWQGSQLTVWDSTQSVHPNRQSLAEALKLPLADIRLIGLYSGGGFGSKLGLDKHTVLVSLAARELNRPVKCVHERDYEAMCMGNRPANSMTLKAGCKKDGTLTALSFRDVIGVGAYPSGSGGGQPIRELYKCPNVATEEHYMFINGGPGRPHRAPGRLQGTFALAQVVDTLAEKCGIDPVEFRLRNYSDVDQQGGKPYSSKGLREAYTQGATKFDWAGRGARKKQHSRGAKKRGTGLATQVWGGAGGPPAYAILKLFYDGTATLYSGAQDIGTATRTTAVMVASEELGLPVEKMTVVMGDTQAAPYGFVSGGSLTTASITPAIRMAAADVKRQLLEVASKQMDLPADRLATREDYVFDTENPSTRKSIAEVMGALPSMDNGTHNMLIGKGWRGPNPDDVAIRSWGAQFAEVEVDTDTGEVKVIKVVAAHEFGRVVNPLSASGQIEGGVIQGIGYALYEEQVMNGASGRMVNANLHDYKLPTSFDIPEIEPLFIDQADAKINSVGVKGLGEPPIIPTAAAIANAIYDAVGVRLKQLPMTPQRVLAALAEGGRNA